MATPSTHYFSPLQKAKKHPQDESPGVSLAINAWRNSLIRR